MLRRKLIILFILIGVFGWDEAPSRAVPMESLVPKKNLPEGWVLIEGPRTFTKKTLFEHINGQAELFFKYGFQKSVFAIYQDLKSPESEIGMVTASQRDWLLSERWAQAGIDPIHSRRPFRASILE